MKVVSESDLKELVEKAKTSERRRAHLVLSKHEDIVQRMFNAGEIDTYFQPHRHNNVEKIECFLVLRGRIGVLVFNDDGTVAEKHLLSLNGKRFIEILPRTFHMLIYLEPGTLMLEFKGGSYDAAADKKFASWAPVEGTPESKEYLNKLRKEFE